MRLLRYGLTGLASGYLDNREIDLTGLASGNLDNRETDLDSRCKEGVRVYQDHSEIGAAEIAMGTRRCPSRASDGRNGQNVCLLAAETRKARAEGVDKKLGGGWNAGYHLSGTRAE